MRITGFQTFHLKPRWLLLKLTTDVGIEGWGEPALEGMSHTVEKAVHEFCEQIIGEDPQRIEHLWQRLYRGNFYRGGPVLTSALSGIDQALWDILGKHLGVPVWQLLGGKVRDRIRLYGWIDAAKTGDYVEDAAENPAEMAFTAYKIVPMPEMRAIESPDAIERIIETVTRFRAKLGHKVDLGLDFHGRCSPAMARRLAKRLEAFDPMFLEEPVLPTNRVAYAELRRFTSIPIAGGERLYTRWDYEPYFQHGALDVAQPDLSHAGGISEVRRIAAMAEVHDVALAPHCPLGPVTLASCLQIAASTPNFLCQEHLSLGQGILKSPFEANDGYVTVPDGPGLGIEIDEAALPQLQPDKPWRTTQFRHRDGSVAEW